MPCMWNGKPVAGNKGSCPTNSTWVDEPSSGNKYAEGHNWFEDRYVTDKGNIDWGRGALDAGTAALTLGTGYVGAARIGGGKALKWGMDKLFRTNKSKKALAEQVKNNQFNATVANTNKYGLPNQSTRNIPGQPARQSKVIDPNTGKPMNMPAIPASTVGVPNPNVLAPFNAQAGKKGMQQLMDGMGNTRRLSPLKIGGTAALGTAAYDQFGPGLTAASKEQRAGEIATQQASQQTSLDANTQALTTSNASAATAQAEVDRVANLNPMERIMENLKKPGFLTDPLIPGGPQSYNRLSKLGVLMDYYGSTPKQRATKTSPNEQFASIEKDVLANQTALAKAQQTLSSPFGKPNVNTLADSLMNKVKAEFGDTWLTFGAKDDQLEPIAKAIAIRITQLTAQYPQSDPKAIEEEAFKQIEEEGWKSVA